MLTEQEELELLQLLEEEEAESAVRNYDKFAGSYIKIIDKNMIQVPLIHNEVQKVINQTVIEMRTEGKPVRIIVLKARQEGVSTNEQGRMLWNTATKKNSTGLIIAQDDDTCTVIFNKAKYMYDNLPEPVKPLKRASNAKELIFDRPTHYRGAMKGLNSRIRVQVAGRVSIGRGDTIKYVHISEFAYWEAPKGKEPKKQLAGILQAVPNNPDTEVVIESTANGYNDFKDLWDDACAGKNEWKPLFFPWHVYKEYQMECTDEEFKKIVAELDSKVIEYLFGKTNKDGSKTIGIADVFNLTKEQIKWYIWKLKNACNSDLNMMKQENPSNPDEAFIQSGSPVFDNEKIENRIAQLERVYKQKPYKRGYFSFKWRDPDIKDIPLMDTIRWVDDKNGCIRIYEDPKPGYPYTLGGDTKGEGSDFFAGTARNNNTGIRAAVLHGQMDSKYYTGQMQCLGYHYNTALISIETNFNTYPIELLSDWHYPRQYQREKVDTFTGERKKSYGWKTDGNTRPLIIEREITLINENIDKFTDIDMLRECLTFVNGSTRPDAMVGKHDDILFSDMISEAAESQQTHQVNATAPVKDSDDDDDDAKTSGAFYD
jgi:hypothetical protein